MISTANGGKFKSGFLAAGFTEGFSDVARELAPQNAASDIRPAQVVIAATIGGAGSVLGGGKFANGAVTGAFSNVFNEQGHPNQHGQRGPSGSNSRDFFEDIKDVARSLYTSVQENLQFGTTAKAVFGSGVGASSIFTIDGISRGDTTIVLDYSRGAIFTGGAFVRGDVYSSGKIDGYFQSGEICLGGCIRSAWDYRGNFNIGTKLVFPIAIGASVSGGYSTSGRALINGE